MAVKNNPVLGTIPCRECKGEATVHQAARGGGRFLYTRCPECKADQRTGAAFQTRLFKETQWRDGVKPLKPSNVKEGSMDWSPNQGPAKVSEEVGQTGGEPIKTGGGGAGVVVGVLVFGSVLAVWAMKSSKKQKKEAKKSLAPMGVNYESIY
jgi:hypothetical protein